MAQCTGGLRRDTRPSPARGENGGITLPHRNVVKQLVKLGSWSGAPAKYAVPEPKQPELRQAVLVQAGPGGAIIAAARGDETMRRP